jgi:hypothetical protein
MGYSMVMLRCYVAVFVCGLVCCVFRVLLTRQESTKHIIRQSTDDKSHTTEYHHYAATHYFKDFNITTNELFYYILSIILSSTKLNTRCT